MEAKCKKLTEKEQKLVIGGAVCTEQPSTDYVHDTFITSDGGAICTEMPSTDYVHDTFITSDGGAICTEMPSTDYVHDTFIKNAASDGGDFCHSGG